MHNRTWLVALVPGVQIACLLILWDAVVTGSFVLSAIVCPIWVLVSFAKNAIQRPGWKIVVLRVAIPMVTLGVVLANAELQRAILKRNAARVILACEEYRAVNSEFPETLDDLVPRYLRTIPLAKYCLIGKFQYINPEDRPPLLTWWTALPTRNTYDFQKGQWVPRMR